MAGGGDQAPSEDRAGAVFGALADPTRRTLLAAIAQQPAATATELAAELPISRQAVLKIERGLRPAGRIRTITAKIKESARRLHDRQGRS